MGEIQHETFERLADINKLYSVAKFWIFIAVLYDLRSILHKIHFIYHTEACDNRDVTHIQQH